jgi:hypothetical protein
MNKIINSVLNWFLKSSANPDEVAMTVKGIATLAVGQVFTYLSTIGLNPSMVVATKDIAIASAVVGIALTVFGAVRKIVLTAQTNVVPTTLG